jgi:type II secretory pathway component PulF
MQAYWITYLAHEPETADAKLEKISGQYRHRTLQQASSPRELIHELRKRGCTALEIKPARTSLAVFDNVISREYKVDFLTSISNNMSSGCSASKAYELVATSETGAIRIKLEAGLQVLARGGSFSQAIFAINIYDETTNILLDAGERTGDIKQALSAAIEHYTSHQKNMKGLYALAGVVGFDLLASIPSIYAVRYELLPAVEKAGVPQGTFDQIEKFNQSLQFAYLINDLLLWFAILSSVGAAIVIVCFFEKSTRDWAFSMFQKIPLLGQGMRDQAMSAATKALSSLLSGGVTLVRAIEIIRAGIRHPDIASYFNDALRRLEAGDLVGRALRSQSLSRAESLLIASHQSQAQLSVIMRDIALRRAESSAKAYHKFAKYSIYFAMGYTVAGVLAALYVYVVQSSAMSAAL